MHVTSCRLCNHRSFQMILRLGKMPLVNYFPSDKELRSKEERFPLNLCRCANCGLVQLDEVIPPNKMFRNYHYLTSASQPLIEHFKSLAESCIRKKIIQAGDKVLDIGANDGTLLSQFKHHKAQVLGVDPSLNAVQAAKRTGIEVLPYFFGSEVAKKVRRKHGRFDLITGTNVFAHTHNVRDFMEGVKTLLAPKGTVILEFAHLLDMIQKRQFDVIYHEHVSFFSLHSLIPFFHSLNMEIFDVKKVLTQGGSLRIYIRHQQKNSKISAATEEILQEEHDNHIHELSTLKSFAQEVLQFRSDLRTMLKNIRKKGHRIAGYGAPAKGVILLNFCKIGPSDIVYLVDSTELKQGRFFPGNHIPVYSEQRLEIDLCEYVFLLSWNFQEIIMQKLAAKFPKGIKVIIPFPKLRIL